MKNKKETNEKKKKPPKKPVQVDIVSISCAETKKRKARHSLVVIPCYNQPCLTPPPKTLSPPLDAGTPCFSKASFFFDMLATKDEEKWRFRNTLRRRDGFEDEKVPFEK